MTKTRAITPSDTKRRLNERQRENDRVSNTATDHESRVNNENRQSTDLMKLHYGASDEVHSDSDHEQQQSSDYEDIDSESEPESDNVDKKFGSQQFDFTMDDHDLDHQRAEYMSRQFDDADSSDEEDLRNTIGNIPVKWYEDMPHVGYDWQGKTIKKNADAIDKGEIDDFIAKMEDPDYWRRVKDRQLGKEVTLTDDQVSVLDRIQSNKYPVVGYNPYEPWIDFFTYETMIHPVSNRPDHKRSFVPSKLDKEKVSRMVHSIKMGWLKPRPPKPLQEKEDEPVYYDLWADQSSKDLSKSEQARLAMRMPAPKLPLPGHAESYNPPAEYLMTEKEKEVWEEQEPDKRKQDFIPEKHSCLRHVPAYPKFVNERFERCLDLYLAPRQRKMKLNVDPNDLLPKLPDPKDLQPFPTTLTLTYRGHSGLVRCVCIEPTIGQFVVSGSDDGTMRVWETTTGRCLRTIAIDGVCHSIAWCRSTRTPCLVAAAVNDSVVLFNIGCGDKTAVMNTDTVVKQLSKDCDLSNDGSNEAVQWKVADATSPFSLALGHKKPVKQVCWHASGDYLATVCPDAESNSVIIHQLSRMKSKAPFSKSVGSVQNVAFHRTRPLFFVATKTHVRIYDLQQQQLTKKLFGNCRWISSICVHPKGDNLIVGSYDCRLNWFDLDLSAKPYKTLSRHHKGAIRSVTFHEHYPLFASCGDDGKTIVCHGQVYSDLLQNALIVPVKVLGGHTINDGLGVLQCCFHPRQPWLVSAGADCTLKLYT